MPFVFYRLTLISELIYGQNLHAKEHISCQELLTNSQPFFSMVHGARTQSRNRLLYLFSQIIEYIGNRWKKKIFFLQLCDVTKMVSTIFWRMQVKSQPTTPLEIRNAAKVHSYQQTFLSQALFLLKAVPCCFISEYSYLQVLWWVLETNICAF